jgi:hypothetical protein
MRREKMEFTHCSSGSASRFRQVAATAIFLFALFGCAYGKLVLFPLGQDTIYTFIESRYTELEASYSGIWEKPGALRFDIKGDGIQLTGSGWQPLESKEAILEIVRNMQATYRKYRGEVGSRGPRLYTIMNENEQPIGYIYTPIDVIPVRPDGKNYEVDAITETDVRNYVYPWRQPTPRSEKDRR